jgi:protein phosphatase
MTHELSLPELSLVVLIGISGSGKSTFAARHFLPTEVISSDYCRGLVADDESSLEATGDAFELLRYIAAKRLKRGHLTVIDATSVQKQDRRQLIELARQHDVLAVAVVLNPPMDVCRTRNLNRPNREMGPHVLPNQSRHLKRSLRGLRKEGFRYVSVLNSVDEIEAVTFKRTRLWTNRRDEPGPFDVMGDVHGCLAELLDLMNALGYEVEPPGLNGYRVRTPPGRRLLFVGDLVDRGPDSAGVLELVMDMCAANSAVCVPGNHDAKLLRKLRGRNVQMAHGLEQTWAELNERGPEFKERVTTFIDSLISHFVFDDGRLVVAHAGMKEAYQGRASGRVRQFALFGETTGETDEFGLPIRYPWAQDYRGDAVVVYGHTPVPEPIWLNKTINIDTGCAFGGKLTALRYPELELVSVAARQTYAEPIRPLENNQHSKDGRALGVLDISDVTGKRVVHTRLRGNITISAEHSAAALEVMSRFAVDPRWLIYLPPTMAPTQTSKVDGFLERPEEVFKDYRQMGIDKLICEEKHMGSRAIIVVCRDDQAAATHFGIQAERAGVVYTRTGRHFFTKTNEHDQIVAKIRQSLDKLDWWSRFESEWFCFDAEILPWSAKAKSLLQHQYAPVAASGEFALEQALEAVNSVENPGDSLATLKSHLIERAERVERYRSAYQAYCWPVAGLSDIRIAPFHLLASQGHTYSDRSHVWHMEMLSELCGSDSALYTETRTHEVDLADASSEQSAIGWWESLTAEGGEGMVVKPLEFIAEGKRGIVQPAIKCRGRDYLRIIYGPEYDRPDYLAKLRKRGLQKKRSLALREFALGLEGLERFTSGEPLYRVHECSFAVLALESDPVDPRL